MWIAFFIITVLIFVFKPFRVQAYVWVIAVIIIQPYSMVHYQSRIFMVLLAQPAVNGHPIIDICLSCSEPCLAFIKLFLGQMFFIITAPFIWATISFSISDSSHRKYFSAAFSDKRKPPPQMAFLYFRCWSSARMNTASSLRISKPIPCFTILSNVAAVMTLSG